jgi:hypothetical protein
MNSLEEAIKELETKFRLGDLVRFDISMTEEERSAFWKEHDIEDKEKHLAIINHLCDNKTLFKKLFGLDVEEFENELKIFIGEVWEAGIKVGTELEKRIIKS